jgi:hypothetical protein
MKHYILTGLLLGGLASCAKKDSDPSPPAPPAPTLTGGTWTFQSETVVTTPKSGGATTTATTTPAGTTTLAFTDATHYTLFTNEHNAPLTGSGTYTYSANTITSTSATGSGVLLAEKLYVSELSAKKLVLIDNSEDATNRYVTTDTFTR